MTPRSALFALVVLAATARSGRTNASVCLAPDQVALPLLHVPAPTNTHVWLFVSKYFRDVGCAKPPCEGRFVLRTAAGDADAREIPIAKATQTTSGTLTAIELVPARDLPPLRTFETWWIPRDDGAPRLMSAFRTGKARDESSPTALALTRVYRFTASSMILGESGVEQIVFEGEPGLDDGTPAPLYAIWIDADPTTGRPPDAILDRALMSRDDLYRPRAFVAGTGASCYSTFTGGREVVGKTLVVRALDLAGNPGPPSVVVVAPR